MRKGRRVEGGEGIGEKDERQAGVFLENRMRRKMESREIFYRGSKKYIYVFKEKCVICL